MAYTDRAAVEVSAGGAAALIQLTDLDGDGVEDAGLVDTAIADADAEINSYARKVFSVPMTPTPDFISALAKRLAVYNLKQQRNCLTEDDEMAQKARIKWLENLAAGKVDPGGSNKLAPSGHNRATSTPSKSTRRASRDALKGFA